MLHAARIRKLYLYRAGISKAEIARRLKLPRTSVRRVPCHGFFPEVGRPTPYARLPKAHVQRRRPGQQRNLKSTLLGNVLKTHSPRHRAEMPSMQWKAWMRILRS